MRKAYFESPVIDGARYDGIVVLLTTFGCQLSEHIKDLIVIREEGSPVPVQKALAYIERRLDEHLGLDTVALESGLSVSQFCKVFKETTGTTFTEYVNRRRVDWARRELLRPGARVTEIAYRVGFASLSQFNRSFQRFVGEAPRSYRKRRLVEVV
ncbi:MAG: helix-turn-helix transcriptional regulator [Deltaproteobacteria bacterium]|nr:helix-turn-helix transcriptional regulator [Deltaproteobacteria bacterium]